MTKADMMLYEDIFNVKQNGHKDENPRPKYKDGTPAHTFSINHVRRQYDLSMGEFPICTLRPIAWKNAIKEILWIYQDQSNSLELLREKYNIKWWDEWESKDLPGTIGVRYGETVRRHNLVDKLLAGIKTNPYGRRHIMSLWQEEDFNASDGLMPCCYETIWSVNGAYLDMMMIQRSGDMLVASGAGGVNEVQYAALLMMVAHATGYMPGVFTHIIGNEQIYDRHIEVADELMKRYADNCFNNLYELHPFNCQFENNTHPRMNFYPSTRDFYCYTLDNFTLDDYNPITPQLTLEVAV